MLKFYSNKIFLFESNFFIRIKFLYSNRFFLFEKNFLFKSIFLLESNLSSTQKGPSTQKVVQSPKFLEVIG